MGTSALHEEPRRIVRKPTAVLPASGAPGETRALRIIPFPTANLFLPGHRVRPDASSSNFPKFDLNPNTGEAEGEARRQRRAVNSVFTGPSRIVLPELPE